MLVRLKNYHPWLIFFLVASSLFADENTTKDTPVFRSGTWEGQQVDTALWSHAQAPSPDQLKAISKFIPSGEAANYHIFQNLKHNNAWRLAAVPKDVSGVSLYLQEMALGGKISHGFMGFHFDKPVIVINNDGSGQPTYLKDIIVSNDGARPIGQAFDAMKGFGPNLILHTNFTSLEQVYTDYGMSEAKNAELITQFKLPQLDAEMRKTLLGNSIELSKETGYSRIYHTLSTRNCCGQVFALLDSVLPKPKFLQSCRIGLNHVATFLPGLFRDGMTVRNIYNKRFESKLINDPNFRSIVGLK